MPWTFSSKKKKKPDGKVANGRASLPESFMNGSSHDQSNGQHPTPQPAVAPGIEEHQQRKSILVVPQSPAHAVQSGTSPKLVKPELTVRIFENGPEKLDQAEEGLSAVQSQIQKGADIISQVNSLFAGTNEEQDLVQKVDRFVQGSQLLMNALDEVQKLHPFIGVAVLAFKAVWKLEELRRDNDKKVKALYTEMGEMMSVLLELKDVQREGVEGKKPEERLGGLVRQTAQDIKACGNACDVYGKKKLIVKAIQSPLWDGRLAQYVRTFATRRNDFQFALSIFTAGAVGVISQKATDINAKVDILLKMFSSTLLSPEEKDLNNFIKWKGGGKPIEWQERDDLLGELSEYAKQRSPSTTLDRRRRDSTVSTRAGAGPLPRPIDIVELKKDLARPLDSVIAENQSLFDQKFEHQRQQIMKEIERVIQREGDRVIEVLQAGAHDQVIDKDLQGMWKEWGWKGAVKARTFIMAFREYFQPQVEVELQAPSSPVSHISTNVTMEHPHRDAWALQYLKISNVQPVQEAFDDDASGFVSVAEANNFAKGRPEGWSLPEWVAFWAVGWHMSLWEYKMQIEDFQNKMFGILPDIKPENRGSVNDYLVAVDRYLTTLTASLNIYDGEDDIKKKFWPYCLSEQARLKSALSAFQYHIDAFETVSLITGQGRIERFIFPLVSILLERHFELFRICTRKVVWREEFTDAAASLRWCFVAFDDRATHLYSIFKQQGLDPKDHFSAFAHGMFDYWYSPDLFAFKETQDMPYHDESPNIDEKILRHGFGPRFILENNINPAQPGPLDLPNSIRCLLGRWRGVFYNSGGTQTEGPMFSLTLHLENKEDFTVQGAANIGELVYEVDGRLAFSRGREGPVAMELRFREKSGHSHTTIALSGEYHSSNDTIVGLRELTRELGAESDLLMLSALPPEILRRYRPVGTPATRGKRARALWKFVGSMVIAGERERLHAGAASTSKEGPPGGEHSAAPSEFYKDRLRALWFFAASNIRGTFLLSRLSPERLRSYPYPDDLSRSRYRALWKFAISYNLTEFRSRSWTRSHFEWRRRDRTRYIRLLTNPPKENTPDMAELREWQKLHTPSDDLLFRSQASFRQQGSIVDHGGFCDSCRERLGRARIICLTCKPKRSLTGSIDLCTNCLDKPLVRDDLQEPHLPSHNMMKVTQVVHNRHQMKRVRDASAATMILQQKLTSSTVAVVCSTCKQDTKQHFWFCVDCSQDVFICRECDEQGRMVDSTSTRTHRSEHAIVWCQFKHGIALTGVHHDLDKLLNDRLAPFDARLDRLEAMLGTLLQNMSQRAR